MWSELVRVDKMFWKVAGIGCQAPSTYEKTFLIIPTTIIKKLNNVTMYNDVINLHNNCYISQMSLTIIAAF